MITVMPGNLAAAAPWRRAKPGLEPMKPLSVLITTAHVKPSLGLTLAGTGTTRSVVVLVAAGLSDRSGLPGLTSG
ncbi:MAG: hypothetical protein ACLQU2_18360 [Candidatus Binataceae bacterium]